MLEQRRPDTVAGTSVGYPVGVATDKGPQRPLNADACSTHLFNGTQAFVVIDGTGSTPEVGEFAANTAWATARVAARRDPGYAILYAAELNAAPDADPDGDLPEPDGAIVVATLRPATGWSVASAGDAQPSASPDATHTR